MKKNQKSIRGGIQDFLFPFSTAYVTQWSHGAYTHKGTCAMDFRGSKAGAREAYFAPADVKCVWIYPSSGQAMWQTIKDVRCPNGYVGKVTFMTVHDDTFDCVVGMTRSQGMQIGNMGTKGNATGVHCHLQIAQTSSTRWYKNKYGIYQFDYEVEVEEACFMDGTDLLNWNEKTLRYTKDIPVEEPKPTTGGTLVLPASATSWRVYPTNVAPVTGNECGKLFPSKFGGLTYDIIGRPQTDVVTIKTRDYGTVNIYVAPSTGAIIK